MIMPRGSELLMPVNPVFLWFSLLVAFALNLIPLGRVAAMPDLLAVTIVFWNVHQPRRVSVGVAFCFGLLMDVHHGSLLGQHALAYTMLSFLAIAIHRRLLWFNVPQQALHVLPIFVLAHFVSFMVRMSAGGVFPGWSFIAAPFIEGALWPIATLLLQAPQRRPPDPDQNRPL